MTRREGQKVPEGDLFAHCQRSKHSPGAKVLFTEMQAYPCNLYVGLPYSWEPFTALVETGSPVPLQTPAFLDFYLEELSCVPERVD